MILICSPVILSPPAFHKSGVVKLNPTRVSLGPQSLHISRVRNGSRVSLADAIPTPNSVIVSRLSHAAITEAQNVLFDYLHLTRSLSAPDAEHISKNAPHFVNHLLSKIDSRKDVSKSLHKYLRFHPINEFEPFFESLGLNPSELPSLLPRHLMFLADDMVLLDNVHVLSQYGIPRSRIGKMYKEVQEVFRSDRGVLVQKLEAYENLGLSKQTVIKLLTCCSSLLVGAVDSNFVQALEEIKRIGVEVDVLANVISGKVTYDWARFLDTINLLHRLGYSEPQSGDVFRTDPALLFGGWGEKVLVLLGHFLKSGLKMSEIYSLFIRNPELMSVKFVNNILLAVNFLLSVGMPAEDIGIVLLGHIGLIGYCSLKGPRTVFRYFNVGKDELSHIIKEDPVKFFCLASKRRLRKSCIISEDPSKRLEKIAFLLRLGYVENSEEITEALKKFRGRGDQLQERFNCIVEAGLQSDLVAGMVKKVPTVLNQSKDVIEEKLSYLTNSLGYPVESVVHFPACLCYDMERISQRFSMCVWLKERGTVNPTLSISTILACSDARFVKYFVNTHPEGPEQWEHLKKSLCSNAEG